MRFIFKLVLLTAFLSPVLGGTFSAKALANSDSSYGDDEKLIRQKIRARAYPGGVDEEPLKVQEQLPIVGRKMQPAQEPVDQEDTHTNESND